MDTEPLREVKDRFSDYVERVAAQHERILVTRNGKPAAVLINPDDLEALEETLAILADTDAIRDIVKADKAYARGQIVRGVDAVRRLKRK
jgi:antitoxin YefM